MWQYLTVMSIGAMRRNYTVFFPLGFVCGLVVAILFVHNIAERKLLHVVDEMAKPTEVATQKQALPPCQSPFPIHSHMSEEETENASYSFLERTTYKCEKSMRVGNADDGGWNRCCDSEFELHPPNCLVYSFGIADDWTFDDDMAKKIGCQVFSFDPSIKVKSHQRSENNTFLLAGLGGNGKSDNAGWELKTLGEWRKQLHHDKMVLDYLKFDIEGGEWPALKVMFAEGSLNDVRQLALEIHIGRSGFHNYFTLIHELENVHGFRKWSSQPNRYNMFTSVTGKQRSTCIELVYVNSRFMKKPNCEE